MAVRHSSINPPLNLLGLLLATRRGRSSTQEGFSLLECLAAIAVVMLTAALITPALFIATATRVQNRRAEQALQLAQGEIDRLRVLMTQGQNTPARLPVAVGTTNFPAPSAPSALLKSVNSSCNTYNDQRIDATAALRVDVDGDCQVDFFMQTFRTAGSVPASEDPTNNPAAQGRSTDFTVGVRVYSFLAESNMGNGLETQQASLQLTTGQGSQRRRPLAVLYSRLNWSDQNFNLCQIHRNQGQTNCR